MLVGKGPRRLILRFVIGHGFALLDQRRDDLRVAVRLIAVSKMQPDARVEASETDPEIAFEWYRPAKRIFEINPEHPLVVRLNDEADMDRFNDLALVLYDQAKLAEGTQLEEPASYVSRLNKLLLDLSA